MFDRLGDAIIGITIYQILKNFGGLVLVLFAVVGYGLVIYKHRSENYGYRFSFRQVFDLFNMLFFGTALVMGILLLIGVFDPSQSQTPPSHVPPSVSAPPMDFHN